MPSGISDTIALKRQNNVKNIIKLLIREYPDATTSLRFNNPLNLLIATILSAQCTDKTVNKVTVNLFKKYRNAGDYAKANLRILMGDIKSIGLYRGKARNIKAMAKKIIKNFNCKVPDSIAGLTQLPGVGRKTANIVLSNAFKKNEGIAVDTHVMRITKRLGLTNNDNAVKIEVDLLEVVPKIYWGIFNHLLVTHGRAICRARNPLHDKCVVRNRCAWYGKKEIR